MAILDFPVSGLCRRHGFGSVTQVCFGISVSNFMCMSFVAVGRSLTYVHYYNPPIAPCYPPLWGGGILVDHWSTIASIDSAPWCFAISSVGPQCWPALSWWLQMSCYFTLGLNIHSSKIIIPTCWELIAVPGPMLTPIIKLWECCNVLFVFLCGHWPG